MSRLHGNLKEDDGRSTMPHEKLTEFDQSSPDCAES